MGLTSLHLSPLLAHLDFENLGSIRDGYGRGLLEAAQKDQRVVGLCADVTESIRMHWLAEKLPQQFVDLGVAEQNLVGVSAGMALAGQIPFAGSYAVFSPGRSWDQVRVSVCYSNLNVKIIGGHAGLTVGPDGATHQSLEDLAMTRVLPNLLVVVPADETEAYQATLALAEHVGPAYLRLSREKSPNIFTKDMPFKLGQAKILKSGKHVTIFACGLMVAQALLAAEKLASQDIQATVVNVHTLKPLDKKTIYAAATATGAVVTAEEHQKIGGLGSAIAEFLATNAPLPMEMVGTNDTFGESGPASALMKKYGLTANDITKAVWKVLERKGKKA